MLAVPKVTDLEQRPLSVLSIRVQHQIFKLEVPARNALRMANWSAAELFLTSNVTALSR